MSRELRVTLAIMGVALIVCSPLIFAAPGPANTNYIAMVFHVVPPPTLTPEPTLTPAPTAAVEPTAIPPSPTLHVQSYRTFSASSSSLYVVGEVVNGTNKAVYFVKVIAKFHDASGAFVATDYGYTILTRTSPGQHNPFRIILSNPPAGITRTDLTLSSSSSSVLNYVPATVISQQTRDNFGVEIFGEVRNDQSKEVKSVEVAATFYDNAGNVYDVDNGYADISPLAPGATSTYRISTFETNLAGLAYALQAQGYLTP